MSKLDKKMMNRAIKYAPAKQIFTWVWWAIFSPRKSKKLINCINAGMHWNASFLLAKNVR